MEKMSQATERYSGPHHASRNPCSRRPRRIDKKSKKEINKDRGKSPHTYNEVQKKGEGGLGWGGGEAD